MNNSSYDVVKQVYDSFGVLPPEQRGVKQDKEEPEAVPEFVDIYQNNASALLKESKAKRPRGSAPIVNIVTRAVISGDGVPGNGLMHTSKRVKDEIKNLQEKGFRGRADILRKQYMEERFIPAVETVIRYSSPDELLNSNEALKALDQYAIGTGKSNGYTASYVRQAYGDLLGKDLDNRFDRSDAYVADIARRIKLLSAYDNIRAAVGLANQAKKAIDNGEHIAGEDDYALIVRVANF